MKCSNGKWKYGLHGSCVFDTLAACKAAAAAIHIKPKNSESCADCTTDRKVYTNFIEKSNKFLSG